MYIAVAMVSAIIGWLAFQEMKQVEQPEYALYYQQPRDIKPFELTDHHGKTFNKIQFKDKWSFVFLGYMPQLYYYCAASARQIDQ